MSDKSVRVLLVEDNPGDAAIVREALRHDKAEGIELVHVSHLAEGLDKLKAERFDLAMLDLYLPDSGGLDTVIRARRAAPGVAIVVCTGVEDEATGAEALKRGAQDYLVKGRVGAWMIRRTVRYAIERKRIEDQLEAMKATVERQVQERMAEADRAMAEQAQRFRDEVAAERELLDEERRRIDEIKRLAEEFAQADAAGRERLAKGLADDLRKLLDIREKSLGIGEESSVEQSPSPSV